MIQYGKENDLIKDIKLEIPGELITGTSKEINYDLLKGKVIVGLCGYAGSGKDIIGKPLVSRLNFVRISFGDAIKKLLDELMREQIFEDLKERNINLPLEDVCQLNPKTREIKEILRPYLIWFGETMKKLNGEHFWTNKALEGIGNNRKVVITDVRRLNELGIFEHGREYFKRRHQNRREVGVPNSPIDLEFNDRGYESLLLHINQRDLNDRDNMTLETIKTAHEQWLFDEIVYIESKIPDDDKTLRHKHILNHVYNLVKKYPEYFI